MKLKIFAAAILAILPLQNSYAASDPGLSFTEVSNAVAGVSTGGTVPFQPAQEIGVVLS